MTTSYSKNMHLSNMFVYYTLASEVSLSSCTSVKTALFFLSDLLLYHYSDFYYRSLLSYGKFKKKSRENHENLRAASLRANFTGFYKKESVLTVS